MTTRVADLSPRDVHPAIPDHREGPTSAALRDARWEVDADVTGDILLSVTNQGRRTTYPMHPDAAHRLGSLILTSTEAVWG